MFARILRRKSVPGVSVASPIPVENPRRRLLLERLIDGRFITIAEVPLRPRKGHSFNEKISDGRWVVGDFYFDARQNAWKVWPGIQTDLIRAGRTYMVGWNGCEEYIGGWCTLVAGDRLHYQPLYVGFFENADPKEWHSDIFVHEQI